jgi:hypothetical protein
VARSAAAHILHERADLLRRERHEVDELRHVNLVARVYVRVHWVVQHREQLRKQPHQPPGD